MVIEIILSLFLGIAAGIITGLLPGIHINLVASAITTTFLYNEVLSLPLAIFIISLSITHVFVDFIPSSILGVPGEDNFLSVLPAHSLFLEGKVYEAIKYALLGCLSALPVFIILVPIYFNFLPVFYEKIEDTIPYIILLASIYLILRERKIGLGLIIFLLSGIVGYYTFNLPIKEPLLPLLSGLFGVSSIIYGLSSEEIKIKQNIKKARIDKKEIKKPFLLASFISPLFSFFPAIGAGHISLFISEISEHSRRQFIFLNGFVSALTMNISIIVAYIINKTRTGTAASIKELVPSYSTEIWMIFMIVIIFSTIVSYYLSMKIAKRAIELLDKLNYRIVSIITLIFVVLINIAVTNSLGLIVLICACSLSLISITLGINRIQLMGSLLVPTLIYYFF